MLWRSVKRLGAVAEPLESVSSTVPSSAHAFRPTSGNPGLVVFRIEEIIPPC